MCLLRLRHATAALVTGAALLTPPSCARRTTPPATAPTTSPAYRGALLAAINRFADESDLHHLLPLLDAHPELINRRCGEILHGKPTLTDDYTPLDFAASHGDACLARDLLNRGADPNAADSRGWTPLHNCAASGNVDTARLLVAAGARTDALTLPIPAFHGVMPNSDINQKPISLPAVPARTPLDLAVEFNHPDIARYLRSVGASRSSTRPSAVTR